MFRILFCLFFVSCGSKEYTYTYSYNNTNFYVYSETEISKNRGTVIDWTVRTFATWPECPNSLGDVEINFLSTPFIPDMILPDGRTIAGMVTFRTWRAEIILSNLDYIKDLFFHELSHVILFCCNIETTDENVDRRSMK